MKMAIIGSGPQAILAAQYFDQIGAEVVLFQRSPLGGSVRFLMEHFSESQMTYQGRLISTSEFFETILVPAVLEIEKLEITKQGDVLRVHKRFLHADEEIENHTRMHDLFRVVYSMNPQESILKQLEENPELFNQLGEEVIASLHKPVESFLDFDIVVEARGFGTLPSPMGAGGSYALNEYNLKDGSLLFYQKEIFEKLDLTNKKMIVLVGEGETAKWSLLKLRPWLLSANDHEIHWVTYKTTIESTKNTWLDSEVQNFIHELDLEFEEKKIAFENALRKWRDLEDYVKVKVPMPTEPSSRLHFHFGYDVTSVDRLLDRPGVFATLEKPDFRLGQTSEMLTLAADVLCVARGNSRAPDNFYALKSEPGYYVLESNSLDNFNTSLQLIETDLFKYFQKA